MKFGNVPDVFDSRDYPFVRHERTIQIPMAFDLQAYFDEPFDQTDGTDTESAVAAICEYWIRRRGWNFERLDPLYLQSKSKSKTIRDCLLVAASGVMPKGRDDPNAAGRYAISKYERIPDLNGILESISQWQPVIIGMKVFESFDPAKQDIPIPSAHEKEIGSCAAAIVGFEQYQRKLTIMHSLGKQSGTNGYFYLPFDYEPHIYDMWTCTAEGR